MIGESEEATPEQVTSFLSDLQQDLQEQSNPSLARYTDLLGAASDMWQLQQTVEQQQRAIHQVVGAHRELGDRLSNVLYHIQEQENLEKITNVLGVQDASFDDDTGVLTLTRKDKHQLPINALRNLAGNSQSQQVREILRDLAQKLVADGRVLQVSFVEADEQKITVGHDTTTEQKAVRSFYVFDDPDKRYDVLHFLDVAEVANEGSNENPSRGAVGITVGFATENGQITNERRSEEIKRSIKQNGQDTVPERYTMLRDQFYRITGTVKQSDE